MSSPIPPDPYEALGVAKDADIAVIRSAHRKLVLKCHPDRIQDPALKDQGKERFQKIQQAYELLSDPAKRSRYDDQIKLAALRREAMARDGPVTRSQTFPMRPAPPREPSSRHFNQEDNAYYEERRPRGDDFTSSRERFEEPLRTASRKYSDYERASATKKPAEKERPERTKAAGAWSRATSAVNFGIRVKKEAERTKASKETKERERRKERQEKDTRTRQAYVDSDSDSDTATRVTSSTIKASSRPTRHSPQASSSRPSTATRRSSHVDDDSDDSDGATARKWESYHDKTKQYIEQAAAKSGTRPKFERHESGSYWSSHHRSGSESDRHASSPREQERHSYEGEPRRPAMPTHTSAPSNLKARVEERVPKDRRSGPSASYSTREREREPQPERRREMPGFHRSKTMPTRSAPSKSSNLKHTETHDSGYGSSSIPTTPDPREDSPVRRNTSSKSKYYVVDPESEDERASRVHRVDEPRHRRYASPEPMNDRRRPERPRVDTNVHTRSRSSRESPVEMPKPRRSESARYDSAPSSRYNSREKLYGEVEDYNDLPSPRYKEKGAGLRSPYAASNIGYDKPRDYAPGSKFQADARGSRRASVQAGVH